MIPSPILRGAVAVVAAVAAVVVFVSMMYWLIRYSHPLPWWDQWNFISSYSSLVEIGGSWISFIFQQHNEHRIAIPRLFFIADLELFGGRNTSLVISNVVIQLSTWIGLCALTLPHLVRRLSCVTAAAFALLLLFSSTQAENFVWGFQVQFVGVYAAMIWACLLASKDKIWGACFFSLIATFMMANGVFIWLILAFQVLARRDRSPAAAWVNGLGFVVCLGGYLVGYDSVAGHTPLKYSLSHPLEFVAYLTAYLGGVVGLGKPSLAIFVGVLELLAFCALSIGAWRRRPLQTPSFWALWSIAAFVLISAVVTASGRAGFGPGQALAGRYATPASIFLICLFFLQATMSRGPLQSESLLFRTRVIHAISFAFAVLVIGLVGESHARGKDAMVGRYNALDAAAAAIASGSGDLQAYARAHNSPTEVEADAEWLKRRGLSVFSERPWSLVGAKLGVDIAFAPEGRCLGHLDDDQPSVGVHGKGAQVSVSASGWAWDTRNKRRPAAVLMVDLSNRVTGIATVRETRSDVAYALRQPRATNSGWRGNNAGGRPVEAYGLVDDNAVVCKLEPA